MKKLIVSALLVFSLSTVAVAQDPPPQCNPGSTNGPPCIQSGSPVPPSLIVTLITLALKR